MTNTKDKKEVAQATAPNPSTPGGADAGFDAGLISSRFRRRLQDRASRESQEQRATAERKATILQSLSLAHRAFTESCRIDLGDRFHLALEEGNADGFPRYALKLVDSLDTNLIPFVLILFAHDRNQTGEMLFKLRRGSEKGVIIASASCHDKISIERFGLTIKKCLRDFIDALEPYVLDPTPPEQMIATQTQALPFDDEPQENTLTNEDFFSEDFQSNRNVIEESEEDAVPPPIDEKF